MKKTMKEMAIPAALALMACGFFIAGMPVVGLMAGAGAVFLMWL